MEELSSLCLLDERSHGSEVDRKADCAIILMISIFLTLLAVIDRMRLPNGRN